MSTQRPLVEHIRNTPENMLCLRSSFAGLLIALTGFLMLAVLGAGIAGFSAESLIHAQDGGGMAFASGAGLWLGLSTVVALFCGTYFALRLSRHVTAKVGAAHGFVIASAFFMILISGLGSIVGGAFSGLTSAVGGAGKGASKIVGNPAVQDAFNKNLIGAKIKGEMKEVSEELSVRLLQGDVESAKNYLAYQTGQTPEQAEAQITKLKADFDDAARRVAEKTAHAVGDASLTLLLVILAGMIGAVFGGRTGAHSNADRPIAQVNLLANARGSMAPYVVGWLLGVPVSLLFLIALLRSVF